MEEDFHVEESLVELVEKAGHVAELLSSRDGSLSDTSTHSVLASNSREFAELVKKVHTVLDDRIVKVLDDQIPLQNNSYLQREELEVAVLKAKYMLSKISE